MSGKGFELYLPKMVCLVLGFLAPLMLSLFWFYPALAIWAGGDSTDIGGQNLYWRFPVLFVAMAMTAWVLLAIVVLIHPVLVVKTLTDFAKNFSRDLQHIIEGLMGDAVLESSQGLTFVFGFILGKVIILPSILFMIMLIVSAFVGGSALDPWGIWRQGFFFPMIVLLLGGLFFGVLVARIYAPYVLVQLVSKLSYRDSPDQPGANTFLPSTSILPFIVGFIVAYFFLGMVMFGGFLPSSGMIATGPIAPTDKQSRMNGQPATDRIGNSQDQLPIINLDGAEHYVTWKGENFIPTDEPICLNGAAVFLPKDKGYVGHSLDPASVLYDPYGWRTGDLNNDGKLETGTSKTRPTDDNTSGASGSAIGSLAARRDAAEAADKRGLDDVSPVRDLGAPWGLGSYYYRGEDQLTGYDFPDDTHIYMTRAFVLKQGAAEVEKDALVVPNGCTPLVGISMRRQLLSHLEVAHLVLEDGGAQHEFSDLTGLAQDISDITLAVENIDKAIEEQSGVLAQMEKLIAEQGPYESVAPSPGQSIVLVQRWKSESEANARGAEERKLRNAIQRRIKSDVTWIDGAQLVPVCDLQVPACATFRNSLSIYMPRQQ